MKVAIIGGGAAGFFAAISAKTHHPEAEVVLLERSNKVLSKVKISGGGRCNVTNGCLEIDELIRAYPRGGRKLKRAFHAFGTRDTMSWFESRGVPLTVQEDNCVFPVSQNSQSIIDCLVGEAKKMGVRIQTGAGVAAIKTDEKEIILKFMAQDRAPERYDHVIVATGGSPKRRGLEWLEEIGHRIVDPVPSLFTFNMPDESVTDLMGIVVKETLTHIPGTKLRGSGPLLITHWGMSGPAILVLSAFGARELADRNYKFKVHVNWVNELNHERVLATLQEIARMQSRKKLANYRPFLLPERLWHFLLEKNQIKSHITWGDLGMKSLHKLVQALTQDSYEVSGKTTFKEEFVTCGGVSLRDVDLMTFQSKVISNLYFAGEVLDIDAITGGYNFQAAWTSGYLAGRLGSR